MSKSTPIQLPLPVEGQTIEIPLTRGLYTLVDAIDADLAQFKWYAQLNANSGKYSAKRGANIHMHRVILSRILDRELLVAELVDHVDLNPLNNKRENLRLASNWQNVANSGLRSHNTSGYKGVTYHKKTGKWRARIGVNGVQIYLGLFPTRELAYEAYCKAAAEHHGEFARLE